MLQAATHTDTLVPRELFTTDDLPEGCELVVTDGISDELMRAAAAGMLVVQASGVCLNPKIFTGDFLVVDPLRQARHGDLIVFEWPRKTLDAAAKRLNRDDISPFAAKRFHWFGTGEHGRWMLVCNETCHAFDEHRIIGPIVRVIRPITRPATVERYDSQGRRVAGLGDISPNAATDIYTGTFAGPTTYAANTGTYTPVSVSFTPAFSGMAIATATFDASVDIAGSQNQVQLRMTAGPTQSGLTFQTDLRRFTLISSQAMTAGVGITADIYVDTTAGVAVTLARAQIRLEAIKR